MTRHRMLVASLALALAVAGCASAATGGSAPSPSAPATPAASATPDVTDGLTRTSEGGEVTAVATWAGPNSGVEFELVLDTHSVDLDALDLTDAIVRNDRGERLPAQPWAAPKGGHHREGTLRFGGNADAFLEGARWMELVLTGVGGMPERVFRWEVAP